MSDVIVGSVTREDRGESCSNVAVLLRLVEEVGWGVITRAGAVQILDLLADAEAAILARVDPSAAGKTDLFTWASCLKARVVDHERAIRALKEALDAERTLRRLTPPDSLAVERKCRAGHTYVTNKEEPGRCWCGEAPVLEVIHADDG